MLTRIPLPFATAHAARHALTHIRKRYRVALRGACVLGPDYFGAHYAHVALGGTGFSAAELANAMRAAPPAATPWQNVNPRAYPHARPLLVDFGHADGRPCWCVVGTDYGFLHTTSGDVRTWGSRSGAARVARQYRQTHGS